MTPKPETPGSQLAAAVCAVMAEAGIIEATGKMSSGGASYSYASEEDVMGKLQPLAAKHGLCILPGRILDLREGEYTTRNGAIMRRVTIIRQFKLLHSSGEHQIITQANEGTDSGDKAVSKALTSLSKYCWRQVFGVVTGDDNDKHSSDDQARGTYNPNTGQRNTQRPAQNAGGQPQGGGNRSLLVVAGEGTYDLQAVVVKLGQRGLYAAFLLAAKEGEPTWCSQFHGWERSLESLGIKPPTSETKNLLERGSNIPVDVALETSGKYLNVVELAPHGAAVAEPDNSASEWDDPGWNPDELGPPLDMPDLTPGD